MTSYSSHAKSSLTLARLLGLRSHLWKKSLNIEATELDTHLNQEMSSPPPPNENMQSSDLDYQEPSAANENSCSLTKEGIRPAFLSSSMILLKASPPIANFSSVGTLRILMPPIRPARSTEECACMRKPRHGQYTSVRVRKGLNNRKEKTERSFWSVWCTYTE